VHLTGHIGATTNRGRAARYGGASAEATQIGDTRERPASRVSRLARNACVLPRKQPKMGTRWAQQRGFVRERYPLDARSTTAIRHLALRPWKRQPQPPPGDAAAEADRCASLQAGPCFRGSAPNWAPNASGNALALFARSGTISARPGECRSHGEGRLCSQAGRALGPRPEQAPSAALRDARFPRIARASGRSNRGAPVATAA
jgi:hypothetical protein